MCVNHSEYWLLIDFLNCAPAYKGCRWFLRNSFAQRRRLQINHTGWQIRPWAATAVCTFLFSKSWRVDLCPLPESRTASSGDRPVLRHCRDLGWHEPMSAHPDAWRHPRFVMWRLCKVHLYVLTSRRVQIAEGISWHYTDDSTLMRARKYRQMPPPTPTPQNKFPQRVWWMFVWLNYH